MHSSSTFLMGKFLCHLRRQSFHVWEFDGYDASSSYSTLESSRPSAYTLVIRSSPNHRPPTPNPYALFTPPLREFYYSNEFMKFLKATINRHTSLPTAQQTTSHHCQLVRPYPGHSARYAWIVSSRCSLLRCTRLVII